MRDAVAPKRRPGLGTLTAVAGPLQERQEPERQGLEPQDWQQEKPMERTYGAVFLGVYIFVLISRVLDLSRVALLHLPLIMFVFLALAALARKGEWKGAITSKTTLFYAALTGWILVCFPLSSWRGGSVEFVVLAVQSFILYLIVVRLINTAGDWRFVAGAYAYAVLAAAILSFFLSKTVQGRVSVASGTLADPNEFALMLVLGLPFWLYKVSEATAIKKIFYTGLTLPILISFGRAGSRSGLLALLALFVVMLIFASMKQKVLMCAVAVLVVGVGAVFLPGYLKVRFVTIFSPGAGMELDQQSRESLGADISSSEARELLLKESIALTLQHPIFGVGPGIFADSAWNERKKEGWGGGPAQVSHNTYTQMSSEIGFPGFAFFTATILICIKYGLSDYRKLRGSEDSLARGSLYMFASLAALAVGVFFLTMGYSMLLSVMFGLAASLHAIAGRPMASPELEETAQAAPPPQRPSPRLSPMTPMPSRTRSRIRFGRYRA